MRLGDLLIQAGLVTPKDVAEALQRQAEQGGHLGHHLVGLGAIKQEALDAFLKRIPAEPANIAATGIDPVDLLTLLMKLIYTNRLQTCRQYVEAIKLPYHIVAELVKTAVDRRLLSALGMRNAQSEIDMGYTFTEEGKRWTLDALQRSRYAGPAPVPLEDFSYQVNLQKVTNELVTFDRIRKALGDLTFDEGVIEQCGPALNSGRAILLYGPPGNGKTSVARAVCNVYNDVIYLPYAISVEGQIIRFYDPSVHSVVTPPAPKDTGDNSFIRSEEPDARWIPCRRPFLVAGGELTLSMLDLRYDTTGHFYEAPLHMKALGGCFVIDDFGRQLVDPANLLNRWIVPLESRVDYLQLSNGKSFSIPFEESVIFSTNLEPEDLMDPAFLRRLPYKIEIGAPSLENYQRIFMHECERNGLALPQEIFDQIVHKITVDKGIDLAAFQPRFIVDQVIATCRFMDQPLHFEARFIDYALNNLQVRHSPRHAATAATAVH